MKWLLGILILGGAAAAGAATLGVFETKPTPLVNETKTHSLEDQTVIAGIGYVEPQGEVRRLGFKIDGRIRKCIVQIGSQVNEGDVLVQLDDSEEQAAVQAALAEVKTAKAELETVLAGSHPDAIAAAEHHLQELIHASEFAQREHKRLSHLAETKSASDTETDKAASHAKQSQAAVSAAKSEIQRLKNLPRPEEKSAAEARLMLAESRLVQAKMHLEQTTLRAPFNGTVLELLKRDGDVVRAVDQEPVLVFADLSHLRVRAEVDERFVDGLTNGMKGEVYGRPLGDKTYLGTVSFVKQLMGPKTVFSRAAAERVDLDVIQIFIDMPAEFKAPVGLRVDVRIIPGEPESTP